MKKTKQKRYLISAYYSDWIVADSQVDAMDQMYEKLQDLRRQEWDITAQDEDDELPDENEALGTRYCDQGCGYKLPEEYADDETTCGACLNDAEDEDDEEWP